MKAFTIKESMATTRMGYLPVGGGGLNASYTTVDAIANICTTAGNLGLKYGKDFIWSHTGYERKFSGEGSHTARYIFARGSDRAR